MKVEGMRNWETEKVGWLEKLKKGDTNKEDKTHVTQSEGKESRKEEKQMIMENKMVKGRN